MSGRIMDHRLTTLAQIVKVAELSGNHFFDPDTRRFFGSFISKKVYPTFTASEGTFFVTSERFDDNSNRLYSVRQAFFEGEKLVTTTIGEFQRFRSRETAHRHAKSLAAQHRFEEFTG